MPNPLKSAEGQSLVELALMLPILLIILLGVIDFGRVFYAYVTITNGSREGARYGSMYPDSTEEIKSRVKQESAGTLIISDDYITVTSDTETITVTVQYDFQTFFFGTLSYIQDWFPAGGILTIRAQTAMPIIG